MCLGPHRGRERLVPSNMFSNFLTDTPGSLVCGVFLCFVTFRHSVVGQVWCLIVSTPDLCLLPYF